MKKLAIITARGGSKRIPRKNIKPFLGKPIIAYSIEAALKSGLFDEVMVSTDDQEIAEIAKNYGAKVPFFRSEATSNDYATTVDVLLEVLETYEKRGEAFDVACCLYPTAPFITADRLREGLSLLEGSDCDVVLPVVAFSYPPKRGLVIRDGHLIFEYPEYLNTRSQDIETSYHDVGQFYLFRVPNFKRNRSLMLGNVLPLQIPETEVQDIDNETDWQLAEMKFRLLHS
ncbi:MAG: pseudaminic acid cytidylyltransferase [Lachnospiraceae bacterium]|nr:pseudaminic acid cytidylyltransferase [Lachnospiraceae bacterium]MBR6151550.1 pseudaminic acid cytidylyltransferase [Lachnospiraceae bacterium]